MKRTCVECGAPCVQRYCAACAMVSDTHRSPRSAHLFTQGTRPRRRIAVTCWCERTTVWVLYDRFLEGHTESCGLPQCRSAA